MSSHRTSGRPSWKLPTWIVLVVMCLTASECQSLDKITDMTLLKDILVALDKAVTFFAQDYSAINLDGLFGVRFCQGNLLQTLNDCSQEGANCPHDLVDKIKTIIDRMGEIGDKAIPYIKAADELYFSRFTGIVQVPYLVRYTPERLGPHIEEPGTDDKYDFPLSDVCFSSLLGTFVQDGRTVPKCTISDTCWRLITKPNTSGYYATHELLYLIVAEHAGCKDKLEDALKVTGQSVRNVQRQLCGRIYSEAVDEERGGKVHISKQDLFIEQILVCGGLGFTDFLREDWMRIVLSWQSPEGCFKIDYPPSGSMLIAHQLDQFNKHKRTDYTASAPAARKLLTEQYMHGNCLSHKTGLGYSTFALYARYLVLQIYAA